MMDFLKRNNLNIVRFLFKTLSLLEELSFYLVQSIRN